VLAGAKTFVRLSKYPYFPVCIIISILPMQQPIKRLRRKQLLFILFSLMHITPMLGAQGATSEEKHVLKDFQGLKPVKNMTTMRRMGKNNFKNQTLPNLEIMGETHFEQVSVEGLAKVMGNTTIEDSQVNMLQVYGALTIQDCVVQGLVLAYGHARILNATLKDTLKLSGYLTATNTIFQKDLQITSEKVVFDEVSAQDIYIHKLEPKKKKKLSGKGPVEKQPRIQKLTLKGKTHIQGSISFESGEGVVVLGPDAQVAGEVIGATIQRELLPDF
jgi:hypothetical protein